MTVALLTVVAGLAIAVVVLAIVVGRRSRVEVELPGGLNQDVLERLSMLQGDLDARLRSVDARVGDVTAVFTNPQGRGGWGELSLRQALEHAGLVEGRDYELNKVAGGDGKRPDGIVKLPDGRKVVVDAKFPVVRFAEAAAVEDDAERRRLLDLHAKALLDMARKLNGRGYRDEAAGGFVVMYLPNEGLYVEAMRVRPGLFDEVRAEGVLLAGPVTLLALLGVTAQVITEHRAVDAARRIVEDTGELRRRLARFGKHLDDVGKKLNTAVKGYNDAVGSWDSRLAPQVRRVVEHVPGPEVPDPGRIDTVARTASATDDQQLQAVG